MDTAIRVVRRFSKAIPGKLYNPNHCHIFLLLFAHACAGVASLPARSTAAKCNDTENAIQTCLTSQHTHRSDRLQVLASPWSPSTGIRSATQTTGESHSQPLFKHKRCPEVVGFLTRACDPELVPGPSTPGHAPVNSVPTSEVATSEQLSSSNIPQATPPPTTAAAATLTTSTNNAATPTNLPGNTVSVPAAESDHRTALNSTLNSGNVTPVGLSQVSAVLRQSTAHPPESSNDITNPTNLVPAPDETQPVPNCRAATSPALLSASKDGTAVGMPMAPSTSLSPTSAGAFAAPGTGQPSMPPTIIATAADTIANVTALGPPPLVVSSSSFVANRTTVSAGSTASTPISSRSSVSLFSVGTTATPSATISGSSNAGGLQFKGAGPQLRGLEMIRLLGYLTVCMIVGARILL